MPNATVPQVFVQQEGCIGMQESLTDAGPAALASQDQIGKCLQDATITSEKQRSEPAHLPNDDTRAENVDGDGRDSEVVRMLRGPKRYLHVDCLMPWRLAGQTTNCCWTLGKDGHSDCAREEAVMYHDWARGKPVTRMIPEGKPAELGAAPPSPPLPPRSPAKGRRQRAKKRGKLALAPKSSESKLSVSPDKNPSAPDTAKEPKERSKLASTQKSPDLKSSVVAGRAELETKAEEQRKTKKRRLHQNRRNRLPVLSEWLITALADPELSRTVKLPRKGMNYAWLTIPYSCSTTLTAVKWKGFIRAWDPWQIRWKPVPGRSPLSKVQNADEI
ncbi:hypothetical protein V8F33_005942 [Rhypophila sp. PSN 637]